MIKHTEGPWERFETSVYFPNTKGGFDLRGCPNAEANAALCAAAPDLLEALEGLLHAYNDPGNTGSTHDDKVTAARAAIARARGES